jgi:hypothetical protein
MNNQTLQLLRGLRPLEAARVDELFPSEYRLELLGAIAGETTTPAPAHRGRRSAHRRRRPLRLGLAGAATAAAAVTVVAALTARSAVSPTTADAVAFRTASNGEIIATVTDPFAAQAQLNAAFAKQGLNITVSLVPVSPSIVGTVLYVGESSTGSQIQPLQGGHCLTGGGGCPIGLKIPKDFTGSGSITLGRPAKPGEEYESAASAFAPGEPLHCSGLLGARVQSAMSTLERDKLTLKWSEVVPGPSNAISTTRTLGQPPTHSYIWGAELTTPGHLALTTQTTPWPNTPGAGAHYNDGC